MKEIPSALLQRALESTRNGLTIAEAGNDDCPLIYVNPAFERLTGYSRHEALGRDCRFLQGPETDRRTVNLLKAALIEGRPAYITLLNYRKDRSAFWNELSVAPIRDAAGEITHFIGIQKDISEQIELQRRLEEKNRTITRLLRQLECQNKRDPLTGAYNRRVLEEDARLLLESSKRGGGCLSVLFIDIDHFKKLNDQYGHQAGDACLRHMAMILQRCCSRLSDLVIRYGGEEFIVVSPVAARTEALRLAEQIRATTCSSTVKWPESTTGLKFTVSIGVVCRVPASGESLTDFIRDADTALYEAKNRGRNRSVMFQ